MQGSNGTVPGPLDVWELEALSLLLSSKFEHEAREGRAGHLQNNSATGPSVEEDQQGLSVAPWPASPTADSHSKAAEAGTASADSHDSLHASHLGPQPARMSSGKTISSGIPAAGFEPDVACFSDPSVIGQHPSTVCQQIQQEQTVKETDGRYGNKAAYRVQSSKKHRLSTCDAPGLSLQSVQPSRELAAKRKRHLSSRTEAAVGDIVAALQRPSDDRGGASFDRLSAICTLNNLTQLPGNGGAGRADKLRTASVQGMLVHPGWHAVVPSDYAITQVLLALEAGQLDLPLSGLGLGGCQSLRDLTCFPDALSKKMLLEMTSRVVNGMSFRQFAGDTADQATLKYTGAVCMMASVVFHVKGDQRFLSKDLRSDTPVNNATLPADLTYAQEVLQLDSHQIDMARHVWKQSQARLSSLRAERAELIAQVNLYDAEPEAWQATTPYTRPRTETLIQQTAALAENAVLEQEVLRHASRIFAWQVCTPDAVARAICHNFPALPNSSAALQAIAAATSERVV
ncbi:hypothetical protein WJX74_010878 [Apatococcus lobatus]|uniref:Uncharacterized protein n=1 Tax=Apatococcus lobatus TaxID=904363 RepID=A0AAW1QX10_9CHLO